MHSLKSVTSASVRSPALSRQGMDGDASVLSGVELQCLSDLFWDATLGSILNRGFFWFVFSSVCYRWCFTFSCLSLR